MKQWIIGGLIILVLIASYLWNRGGDETPQDENVPAEEILVQEDGTVVKRVGDSIEVMSEEEVAAKRQETDEKLAEVEPVELAPVEGRAGSGETSRVFVDGEYFQKVMLSGLPPVQKGYYYEAWLSNTDGQLQSIGRVDASSGEGVLYYSAKEDKSSFNSVVISYEAEDGNPEPGEIVLQGSFE